MENTLAIIFSFTMLYMSASSRLSSYINMLILQGFLLFLIFNQIYNDISIWGYMFLTFETLVVKMIVIPVFILKVIKKSRTFTEMLPGIPRFYSLFVSSIIIFFGFILAAISREHLPVANPISFGVSISVIIISLLFIILRTKMLSCIIGYMMMENGIFLLTLSVEKEMPMIVSMGVLLDLFIAVFILGFLVQRIKRSFADDSINALAVLKDDKNDN